MIECLPRKSAKEVKRGRKTRNCMRTAAIVLLSLWMTSQVVCGEKATTSGILVQGNLRIEGEKDKVVTVGDLVYDLERQSKISWSGIIFEGVNAVSIVRHTKIRYADVAIVCLGSSSPRIVNNTITENDVGLMTFGFSSPRINENNIHHNTLWAVSCYDYSSPAISKLVFCSRIALAHPFLRIIFKITLNNSGMSADHSKWSFCTLS